MSVLLAEVNMNIVAVQLWGAARRLLDSVQNRVVEELGWRGAGYTCSCKIVRNDDLVHPRCPSGVNLEKHNQRAEKYRMLAQEYGLKAVLLATLQDLHAPVGGWRGLGLVGGETPASLRHPLFREERMGSGRRRARDGEVYTLLLEKGAEWAHEELGITELLMRPHGRDYVTMGNWEEDHTDPLPIQGGAPWIRSLSGWALMSLATEGEHPHGAPQVFLAQDLESWARMFNTASMRC